MNFASICTGIGAPEVAWASLGWSPLWFAEIEPFPSSVLAHRFPSVLNLGDMTTIASRVRAGEVAAPDVLVGGTPCQAFSVAGLRGGLADPRGALTLSFVDLANAIDDARRARREPECTILWENVPGVLSSKDNAFGCFLGALAGSGCELQPAGKRWPDAGCVFGPQRAIAWRVLDAQYFGVAQRRRRVFVVASARAGFDPAAVLFERDGLRRDTAPSREPEQSVAAGAGAGAARGSRLGCRADGVDLRNGAITGSVASTIQAGQHAPDPGGTPHVLQPACFVRNSRSEVRLVGGDGQITGALAADAGAQQQHYIVEPVCVTGDIAHTLKAEVFDASEDGTGRGQPIIAFHGSQDPDPSGPITHPLGRNGGLEACFTVRDTSPTLTSNYGKQVDSSDTALGPNVAIHGMRVRRITPREGERLQGFPDDWTLVPYGANRAKDFAEWVEYLRLRHAGLTDDEARRLAADGPRYKAIGNSMAVPCMRWIGMRLVSELNRRPAAVVAA